MIEVRVEELRPIPLQHDRGEITLTPLDGQTKVVWISEGRLKIPIVGSISGKAMAKRTTQAFLGILEQIEAS
jgi:hypothetical protein